MISANGANHANHAKIHREILALITEMYMCNFSTGLLFVYLCYNYP